MAKKGKAKAAKVTRAHPAEKRVAKKKSNTLLYALGVLILIVIIVLIIRSSGPLAKETPVVTPTAPTEKPTGETKPAVTEMGEELYCKEGAAIGARPGFCKDEAGNVEITLTHLGGDMLSGVKYMAYDENMNVLKQEFIMEQFSGNSDKTYKLTVDPNANRLEIRAITGIGGVDKVCTNQRVLVPLRNC